MQEFVNEVISGLQNRLTDCEIMSTEKDLPNGLTKVGVVIKPNGTNIAPTIYLDEFYRNNLPVRDTIDVIVNIFEKHKSPNIDVSWFSNFEKVKPMLRARLYNKSTKAEIFRSAAEYGFDDLIIIPYVNFSMENKFGNGSVKVNKKLLKAWNVSEDEIFETAMSNSARVANITNMAEYFAKTKGLPVKIFPPFLSDILVVNVTENSGMHGAISAITCRSQFTEMFPDGYYVIPASIHEVLVAGEINGMNTDEITEIVKIVNTEEIKADEVLSDHAYKMA